MDAIAEVCLAFLSEYGRDLIIAAGVIGGFPLAMWVATDDDAPLAKLTDEEIQQRLNEALERDVKRRREARVKMFGHGRKYAGEEIDDPQPRALD